MTLLPLLRTVPLMLAAALGLSPAVGSAPTTEQGLRLARKSALVDTEARVIVQYRSDSLMVRAQSATGSRAVLPQHATTLAQRLGVTLEDGRILGERVQAMRGRGLTSAELVARLQAQPEVEWAVIDHKRFLAAAPNDPLYGGNQAVTTPTVGQWYLRKPDAAAAATGTNTTVVSSVDAEAAWAITTGSPSVTVAVLDTGIRADHPDFFKADGSSKLLPGYDFVRNLSNAPSGDGDGVDADPSDPGDFTTSTTCGSGTEVSGSSWHGTQTASLVGAATNNGIGMASIGRDIKVLPVRVLGPCGGFDSDIIAAMYWSAGIAIPGNSSVPSNPNPAQVISMSLGATSSCPASYNAVFSALAARNVTVVVAAGNEAGLAVASPANCSGALAVAGVRHAGTKVGFSNVGPEVTIAAPAGNCVNTTAGSPCLYPILTAVNKGNQGPGANGYSDSFDYSVGTSFATPIVSGTVGLMLSVNPTLTPAQIKSILQNTARPFPTTGASDSTVAACKAPSATEQLECYCTTTTCGAGLLDAGRAVAAVPVLVAPPTVSISVSPSSPTAGDTVTLTAQNATANGGRSIASYSWALTSGNAASFSGATNSSSASLVTSAAGSVVVTLTVVDSAGVLGSATSTVTVQAAPVSGGGTGGGGGGGGGAMSVGWVALLGLAAFVLQRARRR